MQTIWSEWAVELAKGLASLTLRGGVLALAIFAVRYVFRRQLSANWRYGLWALLLVRLLMPVGPASKWSLYGWFAQTAANPVPAGIGTEAPRVPTAPGSEEVALPSPASPMESQAGSPAEFHALPPVGAPVEVPAPRRARAGFWPLAAALWLAGAGWFVLRLAATHLRLARAIARTRPATDSRLLDCLEDCKTEMGLHVPVSLVVAPHVRTPALLGFLRPRLILPAAAVQELSAGELRMVFLHELAHLKRLDIPVAWVMEAVRSLHWFNPLVLLALRGMRRDRELACDERVLRQIGDAARPEYGRALLRFLERAPAVSGAAGLLGIGEQADAMTQRIRRIADAPRRPRPAWGLALFAVLAFTGLTDSATRAGEESGAVSESPELADKPRSPVDEARSDVPGPMAADENGGARKSLPPSSGTSRSASFAAHLKLVSLVETNGLIRVGLRDLARAMDYLLVPHEPIDGIELISADFEEGQAVLRKGEETVRLYMDSREAQLVGGDREAASRRKAYEQRRQERLIRRGIQSPESPAESHSPSDKLVALQFKDASVEHVVRYYCDLLGLDLIQIQEPRLENSRLSLRSTNRLTVEEARLAIETLLDLHRIQLVRSGEVLKTVRGGASHWGETPPPPAPSQTQGEESKIYQIDFKDAPLEMVLRTYAEITGLTIIQAPELDRIRLSLQTNGKRMDYDQTVMVILELLRVNGIQVAHKDFMAIATPLAR